jgi:hypothetical protein
LIANYDRLSLVIAWVLVTELRVFAWFAIFWAATTLGTMRDSVGYCTIVTSSRANLTRQFDAFAGRKKMDADLAGTSPDLG